MTRIRFGLLVWSVSLLLLISALPATAQDGPSVEVVATGLDNPRHLAAAGDGSIYVAESGTGGEGPCFPGPEGEEVCFGLSGAVTRIKDGGQSRILTGLPSLAEEDGSFAIGPAAVAIGRGNKLAVTVGLGPATLEERAAIGPEAATLAHVLRANVARGDRTSPIADILEFEDEVNPDGLAVDTNPFGIAGSGDGWFLADSGGNALLHVDSTGDVSLVHVFPDRLVEAPPFLGLPPGTLIPMQSVPTSVAQGPDGAWYVGELTGFPFEVGAANVYRIVPGEDAEVFATGFTNIMDVAFARDGTLYVLEIATDGLLAGTLTGAIKTVASDGSVSTLLDQGLFAPGGIVQGRDRALYVSTCAVCPGGGEVLRIQP